MWQDIKNILKSQDHFLLTTHINPDGDGLGSACAMIELLLALGKKVRFVCDSPIPVRFAFLDYHHLFQTFDHQDRFEDCEVLIALDTHSIERLGRVGTHAERAGFTTICIDHHPTFMPFAKHCALDPTACSAGAMIYDLYKECGIELNHRAATGIYTSIICDTGRFSHSSTCQKAHQIAEECLKLGVDPDRMHSRLFQHLSIAEIRVFAKALEKMELYLDNKVVIEQICREDCEKYSGLMDLEHIDLDYIHDFNKLIEDVECAVLLRELPDNHVRVSLRSKADLDFGELMKKLGGGGHGKAAGVTLKGSLVEVKQRILELLRELFEQPIPQ